MLLKACGTRREARCPSCAATYRADAYQLLAAGLKGGKGVPESVASHPRLFVTFTAPSFGRVHTREAQGRLVLPCHPYRQGARCPHGTRDGCWHRHDEDDPRLGEPLCAACYDAQAQVLWNALRPSCGGEPPSPSTVPWPARSASRRGSCAGWFASPTPRWPSSNGGARSTSTPSSAWTRPPTAAALPACPHHPSRSPPTCSRTPSAGGPGRPRALPTPGGRRPGPVCPLGQAARRPQHHPRGDNQAGELSAEQVAGYIAKYATKATESFGAGLDRRLSADDLDHLNKLPAHVAKLVQAAWEWAAAPSWTGSGCGRGRTCWGLVAIGRPRAAATPLPSRSCGGPGSSSPSATGPTMACPWTPGADPRTTRP